MKRQLNGEGEEADSEQGPEKSARGEVAGLDPGLAKLVSELVKERVAEELGHRMAEEVALAKMRRAGAVEIIRAAEAHTDLSLTRREC